MLLDVAVVVFIVDIYFNILLRQSYKMYRISRYSHYLWPESIKIADIVHLDKRRQWYFAFFFFLFRDWWFLFGWIIWDFFLFLSFFTFDFWNIILQKLQTFWTALVYCLFEHIATITIWENWAITGRFKARLVKVTNCWGKNLKNFLERRETCKTRTFNN